MNRFPVVRLGLFREADDKSLASLNERSDSHKSVETEVCIFIVIVKSLEES